MQSTAYQYLNQQPILHIDMLELLHQEQCKILDASVEHVLLAIPGISMLSASSSTAAQKALTKLPPSHWLVLHQAEHLPLAQKYHFHEEMRCKQVAYFNKTLLTIPRNDIAIRPLGKEHREIVSMHYSSVSSGEYIAERLEAHAIYGGFIQNKLAGFIGLHEEGSMGMLHVLPQYRKQLVAQTLESWLINTLLQQGSTPFAQIVTDNTPSLLLHQKLGFTFSASPVSWLSHNKKVV